MDKWQRGIPLTEFEPLFKLPSILWVNVQKEKTEQEQYYLNKFGNVIDFTHLFNEEVYAFHDTIDILKNVSLVISTDTSLLHLAATLNVNTYALIGQCCEWRWTNGCHTKWYPNITILKQSKILYWEDIIKYLRKQLLFN